MRQAEGLPLEPGRVYRTSHLRAWGANPSRLARRLVRKGALVSLGHGLYAAPRQGRFGPVPPSDEALLHAFLDGAPWVETGPWAWNALGLGATALFAHPLVYNTKRSGRFVIGGRTFDLRRVAFPAEPPAEWFVVDLLRNADAAGVARTDMEHALARGLEAGRFDPARLLDMATRFGTTREQGAVRRALRASGMER